MTESWFGCERLWNRYLFQNKEAWEIETVGQSESWAKMKNGDYHFFEVKHQEIFEPPPFYGHGLPPHQVRKYSAMERDLGVIWHLVVFDKTSKVGYQQRLSTLEGGSFFDTSGRRPRRIYPIKNFDVWTQNWERVDIAAQ